MKEYAPGKPRNESLLGRGHVNTQGDRDHPLTTVVGWRPSLRAGRLSAA